MAVKTVLISSSDLDCLSPGQCLSGTVIEAYCHYLQEAYPSVSSLCLGTYFFTDLSAGQMAKAHRPFKNHELPIFDLDVILAPLHLPTKHHWALIVGFPKLRRIESFDSLGFSHKTEIYGLFYALKREAKLANSDFRPEAWHLQDTMRNQPRQSNNTDCGVFVLHFVKTLLSGMKIEDVPCHPMSLRRTIKEDLQAKIEPPTLFSPFAEGEGIIEEPPTSPFDQMSTEEKLAVAMGNTVLDDTERTMESPTIEINPDVMDDLIMALDEAIQDDNDNTQSTVQSSIRPPDSQERISLPEENSPSSPCLSISLNLDDYEFAELPGEKSVTAPSGEESNDTPVGKIDTPMDIVTSQEPRGGQDTLPNEEPTTLRGRRRRRRGRGSGTRRIIFPGGILKRIPVRFLNPWNGF